jgi:Uma2 family endonuclease
MASNPVAKISEEEYLALDRAAEVRSEYVNGEMFAMSGASTIHVWLHSNILGELHAALKGSRCKAVGSDARVRFSTRTYLYPDIAIFCGPPAVADDRKDILLNPTVIFEILSPTTERYDRGEKFQQYERAESVRDNILVSQNKIRIEHFSRQGTNIWTMRAYCSLDETLVIDTINASLPVRSIYDGVDVGTA